MKLCPWCKMRTAPLEQCMNCPRYKAAVGKEDIVLDAAAFCGVCTNRENSDLSVFCKTNRYYQEDSGEPFECYNFCLDIKERP